MLQYMYKNVGANRSLSMSKLIALYGTLGKQMVNKGYTKLSIPVHPLFANDLDLWPENQ